MRVAVLGVEDWKKLTQRPYAFPHNLPAHNLIFAPAQPPPPEGLDTLLVGSGRDGRDWLLIAHEGGHLLTWALISPEMADSLERTPSRLGEWYATQASIPRWHWEFGANYFVTAFLEARHSVEAALWTRYLQAMTSIPTPRSPAAACPGAERAFEAFR